MAGQASPYELTDVPERARPGPRCGPHPVRRRWLTAAADRGAGRQL